MQNQHKQKPVGPGRPGEAGTLYDAQRRKTLAEAVRVEVRLKQETGELVPVEDVKKAAFNTGHRVRDLILAVEPDAGRVHALLSNELRRTLEELAAD